VQQHTPLNGDKPLRIIANAFSGSTPRIAQSTATNNAPAEYVRESVTDSLRFFLEGKDPEEHLEDDNAPDGTNGAVKEEEPTRPRAVDPSQGSVNPPAKRHDAFTEGFIKWAKKL